MKYRNFLLLLAVFAASFGSAQTFSSPKKWSMPAKPSQVLLADMNHDGYADLVIALATGDVGVRLANSDGTFQPIRTFHAGATAVAIAVADFNGDHLVDVAVADQSSAAAVILLGNGDGTLRAPVARSVNGAPNSIVAADLNGDGRADIATISDFTLRITILTNTGTSFTRSSIAAPTFFASICPGTYKDRVYSLAAGDFNGDRRIDLAYVDRLGSTDCAPVQEEQIGVLFNNGGGSWSSVSAGNSTGTFQVHAFDVDNDGKSDLVSTYYGCYHEPCTGIYVLYGNASKTFQRVEVWSGYGIGGDPYDAVMGDFNNDGKMDLASPVMPGMDPVSDATVNYGIAVYTGKGGRTGFNAPKYFTGSTTSNYANWITAGFVRNTGKKDIVIPDGGSNGVLEFLNSTVSYTNPCTYPAAPGLHVCAPIAYSTTTTSVRFVAASRPASQPIVRMELWLDGSKKFQTSDDRLSRTLNVSLGAHKATIVSVDAAGSAMRKSVSFTAH